MKFKNNTNGQISLDAGQNGKRITQWILVDPSDVVDTDEIRERFSREGLTVNESIEEIAVASGLIETDDVDSDGGLMSHTIRELLGIAEAEGIEITARNKAGIIEEIVEAREETEGE